MWEDVGMLESFLEMRVFFFITSMVTIIVGALLAAVLWYLLRVARRVDEIVREVQDFAVQVREGVEEAGEVAEEGVEKLRALLSLVPDRARGGARRVRSRQPTKEDKEKGEM